MHPLVPSLLQHIRDEILFVLEHTKSITRLEFMDDPKLMRAVVRSLEIIGEATKKLPAEFRQENPHIDWRRIAATRDVLIHDYFEVDWDIVLDIAHTKLPGLLIDIEQLIARTNK